MKKTLAALAVLGAFAGTAAAADVTLYGDVDTGFKYTYSKTDGEDATNKFEMANGINSASKFGLKGTEDLGNGMTVGFKLENGFNSDDGTLNQSGRLFGREARLFVSSAFGEVSLGRMGGLGSAAGTYDIVYAIGDSFDGGDEFAFGFNASDRYDNMITYQTPQFAGLQATVQYSLKNDNKETLGTYDGDDYTGDEGRSTANRYASFALTGEYGPAQFVAAYELQKYSTYYRSFDHDVKDGQTYYLGGNFDFGVARLFAMGQYFTGANSFTGVDTEYEGTINGVSLKTDNIVPVFSKDGIKGYGLHLGTIVQAAGGELTLGAYYSHAKADDLDEYFTTNLAEVKADYYGFAARYCYPLSERTTIYAGAGFNQTKVKSKNSAGESDSEKTKEGGAYFGISHHF